MKWSPEEAAGCSHCADVGAESHNIVQQADQKVLQAKRAKQQFMAYVFHNIRFLHSVNAKVLVLLAAFVCFSIQKSGFLGACESFCWWQRFGMVSQSAALFFFWRQKILISIQKNTHSGVLFVCVEVLSRRVNLECVCVRVCLGALHFCCDKNVACSNNLMTVNGYVQVFAKW